MSYRSTASFGKRIEYVVIGELLRRGYDVYQTLVDDRGIDCIIRHERNGRLPYMDVQIKARSKDCQAYDAGRFAGLKVDDPRPNYIFLFYSEQVDCYWVFPSRELVNHACRLKRGTYHLNLCGTKKGVAYAFPKYERYLDESGFALLESTADALV